MDTTPDTAVADESHPLAEAFRAFIAARDYPCVGAKSALARGQLDFVVGRDIRSGWNDLPISRRLTGFAEDYRRDRTMFRSFVTIFEGPRDLDEEAFERCLWRRVQSLSDKDAWYGYDYDRRVSHDPDSPHFSLSFAGEAFFVVGLHPRASRPARRFEAPTLVFNLHDQFERLREENRYARMRETILDRDETLAGTVNPMLSEHGQEPEARQYSGRAVGPDWRCPFRYRGEGS